MKKGQLWVCRDGLHMQMEAFMRGNGSKATDMEPVHSIMQMVICTRGLGGIMSCMGRFGFIS